MKKKLIAVAVAGTLAAPIAIADVAVSGSARGGVKYNGSEWTIGNAGSRLRFKASGDLGNDQSVYMAYEFGVDLGKGSIEAGPTNRLTYVGIRGGWGSLSLGTQWSTLFNTVGTFIDKSIIHGGLGYWGNGGGQYRMANSVAFTTQAGPLWAMADAQLSEGGGNVDRSTIGGTLKLGNVTLGAGYQDNSSTDFTGVGAAMHLAGIALSGGWTKIATVGSGYAVSANLADITLSFEDSDSVPDPGIGYHHKIGIGRGAKVIIELVNDGTNTKGAGILRMDF
jgi:predicted porin